MGDITLNEVFEFLKWVVSVGGAIAAVLVGAKKIFAKLLSPLAKEIDEVKVANCMNYLVSFLSRVDRGEPYDEIELERFWEEYKFYTDKGKNHYIKSKVEHLQKDNKL